MAIPTAILHYCTNGWRCADTVARCAGEASPGSSIAPLAADWPAKLKTALVGIESTVTPGVATTVAAACPGMSCTSSTTVGASAVVAVCTSCCAGCTSSSTRAWRYVAWLLLCWQRAIRDDKLRTLSRGRSQLKVVVESELVLICFVFSSNAIKCIAILNGVEDAVDWQDCQLFAWLKGITGELVYPLDCLRANLKLIGKAWHAIASNCGVFLDGTVVGCWLDNLRLVDRRGARLGKRVLCSN